MEHRRLGNVLWEHGCRCLCRLGLGLGGILHGSGKGLEFLRGHGAEEILLGGRLGGGLLRGGLLGDGLPVGLGKLHIRPVRGLVQRRQYAVVDAVKHRLFAEELYLCLGRVDVHIHGMGRKGQVEHTGGEFAHHQLVAVGLLQGGNQQPGFYRPVVDKEGLKIPAGPGIRGLGHIAGQGVAVPLALHRGHGGKVPAIHAVHRRLQGAVPGGGEHGFAVPHHLDGHLRMGQGLQLYRRRHPAALYGVGFHEFHPGRGVEEQIPDDNGGAVRASGLALLGDNAPIQMQAGAEEGPGGLGHQINSAYRGNGGQCLPPEAHGGDLS